MSYLLGDVLVNQQDRNVLALAGEAVEGCFDGGVFGLGVDHQEVLLRVGRGRDVLDWGIRVMW